MATKLSKVQVEKMNDLDLGFTAKTEEQAREQLLEWLEAHGLPGMEQETFDNLLDIVGSMSSISSDEAQVAAPNFAEAEADELAKEAAEEEAEADDDEEEEEVPAPAEAVEAEEEKPAAKEKTAPAKKKPLRQRRNLRPTSAVCAWFRRRVRKTWLNCRNSLVICSRRTSTSMFRCRVVFQSSTAVQTPNRWRLCSRTSTSKTANRRLLTSF